MDTLEGPSALASLPYCNTKNNRAWTHWKGWPPDFDRDLGQGVHLVYLVFALYQAMT